MTKKAFNIRNKSKRPKWKTVRVIDKRNYSLYTVFVLTWRYLISANISHLFTEKNQLIKSVKKNLTLKKCFGDGK